MVQGMVEELFSKASDLMVVDESEATNKKGEGAVKRGKSRRVRCLLHPLEVSCPSVSAALGAANFSGGGGLPACMLIFFFIAPLLLALLVRVVRFLACPKKRFLLC